MWSTVCPGKIQGPWLTSLIPTGKHCSFFQYWIFTWALIGKTYPKFSCRYLYLSLFNFFLRPGCLQRCGALAQLRRAHDRHGRPLRRLEPALQESCRSQDEHRDVVRRHDGTGEGEAQAVVTELQ